MLEGWPSKLPKINVDYRHYYSFHEEITICVGLLLKIDKLLVPAALRRDLLQQTPRSHLGKEKCVKHTKDIVY